MMGKKKIGEMARESREKRSGNSCVLRRGAIFSSMKAST
jgi:hypothetical protein